MKKIRGRTDRRKKGRFFLIFWPNGQSDLAIAESEEDLFVLLDQEGNPLKAEIYEIDPQHMGTVLLRVASSFPEEIPVKRFIRFTEDDIGKVYDKIFPKV